MRAYRALRLAVIADCIFMAALVAVSFSEDDTALVGLPSDSVLAVIVVGGVISLLGSLIGSLAILAGKKWGAWLHLFSNAVGIGATALIGRQMASALSGVIEALIMIATGFIYGLAFFTDALAQEENGNNQTAGNEP